MVYHKLPNRPLYFYQKDIVAAAGVGIDVPIQLLGIFHLQQIFVQVMWNQSPKRDIYQPLLQDGAPKRDVNVGWAHEY